MELLRALFLGIVQGATEFLPISSSGHLVLIEQFMEGFSEINLFFDIMVHLGTLVAVVVFCRYEVMMILRGLTHFFRKPGSVQEEKERRLLFAIVIATIPTALIGLLFKRYLIGLFANYFFLAFTFFVTTVVLLLSSRITGDREEIPLLKAFLIGVVQGIAVLPGISRSGTTIVAGQASGLNRMKAARFAFVLSIPSILGAALLSGLETANLPNFNTSLIFPIFCGMICAAIVGYMSLVVLAKIIEKARLSAFAFYTSMVSLFCVILGIFSLK